MHRVTDVHLTGQDRPFRVHEDAYDALDAYLGQARARLGRDAEGSEVVDDLERSIGVRLAALAGDTNVVLDLAAIRGVLDEMGAVDVGLGGPIGGSIGGRRPRTRKLYRIREDQQIAGVATGLSAYSDIRVDWVRTIFVFATLLSVGGFLVVYVILMFVLPVIDTKADWLALMEAGSTEAGGV